MTPQPPQWTPLPAPPQPQGGYGASAGGYVVAAPYVSKPSGLYKVFGIILLVFGAMGAVWSLISIALVALTGSMSRGAFSTMDTETIVFTMTHSGISIVTGALLGATGFGMYRAKKWSRFVGVGYAALSLVTTFAATAIQILVLQPRMMSRMGSLGGGASGMAHTFEAITLVSTLVSVVVASVIPICVLILVLRSAARDELSE